MARIGCPTCQPRYTFEQTGIHAPNEVGRTVRYTTLCAVCATKFESVIRWQSTKTKHDQRNWFMRNVLRLQPSLAYEFRVQARSRKV